MNSIQLQYRLLPGASAFAGEERSLQRNLQLSGLKVDDIAGMFPLERSLTSATGLERSC